MKVIFNSSKCIIGHNESETTNHKCCENAINSYKSLSSVNMIDHCKEEYIKISMMKRTTK